MRTRGTGAGLTEVMEISVSNVWAKTTWRINVKDSKATNLFPFLAPPSFILLEYVTHTGPRQRWRSQTETV